MHIIFLSRDRGAARSLSLDVRWLLLGGLLSLGLVLGTGVALGSWMSASESVSADPRLADALDAQRSEMTQAREDAQRQLDAFAAHIAELQARLTRLDALGERVAELAELDASEFDFSLGVGQGGPEDALDAPAYQPPPFMEVLDQLGERLHSREQQLEVLEQLLGERRLNDATSPAGRPVRQGYVSSPFGVRSDPLTGRLSHHKGVDFAAKAGSDVLAVGAGVVTWSGRKSGYGNLVEISHADGYRTLYAHNQRNLVEVGDLVQRGQAIAKVGSSGRSTGAHVHFEVTRDGEVVNPTLYIARSTGAE
ncbi:M23 family metallopeptidase [Metapseudomonas otitidis]|uniref:M23 family metallopeptidase n=1 Tax=Metapseudomonas otitidis TaxID=319939 RepID=UPI0025406AEA|nr:M23 family metallopeptidase [Pseudomonas otitidis]WIF68742.1 M23 family metallopeptidase [Pseudomonas otitidis]